MSNRPTIVGFAVFFTILPWGGCVFASDNAKTLRVATLNIAHGRGLAASQFGIQKETIERNLDKIVQLIQRESPAIIALQEADAPSVWSGSFNHVDYLATKGAFDAVHHGIHLSGKLFGVQVQYGTAILSHCPMKNTQSIPFSIGTWHTKGFVTAQVDFDGRSVIVASVHLDSESVTLRRQQVGQMVEVLESMRERQGVPDGDSKERKELDSDGVRTRPLILMGDFNSQWRNKKDAVRLIADALNLHAFKPSDVDGKTFRSTNLTKRIDWILLSPELEFVGYKVAPDLVSDHQMVVADVRWR